VDASEGRILEFKKRAAVITLLELFTSQCDDWFHHLGGLLTALTVCLVEKESPTHALKISSSF
jgi:hypothetical protein